jgi:hypothetical protein
MGGENIWFCVNRTPQNSHSETQFKFHLRIPIVPKRFANFLKRAKGYFSDL